MREVEDERNNLVFEFARLVAEIQPRYFVMENVPGLAGKAHQRLLTRTVSRLEQADFTVGKPMVVDAAELGVPQARRRLVLWGHHRGESELRLVKTKASSVTVWDAIRDLSTVCRVARLAGKDEIQLTKRDLRRIAQSASPYSRRLRRGSGALGQGYPRDWNPRLLTNVRLTVHESKMLRRFAATAQGDREPVSRYLRLPPHGLAPVLRAGTGRDRGSFTSPRPIHPFQHRVLNVREAARLQSFPDWFNFHVTNWHGFRQVGNAVPPELARLLGKSVRYSLPESAADSLPVVALGDRTLLTLGYTAASTRFREEANT